MGGSIPISYLLVMYSDQQWTTLFDFMAISKNTIKYFIYPRKSGDTEDKQVLSIPAQKKEIDKLVEQENLCVADTLDESHSAKAPGRPVFNDMMARIKRGEANGIIVWSANRLSRNSVDTGQVIYFFDIGKIAEVRTPTQIFKNTPNDKFLLNLFCSQAKLENDNKGVDVKRGLKEKAERGWYPGVAKPGYKSDYSGIKGEKIVHEDSSRLTLIKKAFSMVLEQIYTPVQILEKLNNEWGYKTTKRKQLGDKPMARSTFYNILSDPYYYGWYEYPKNSGNWYQTAHKPIITEDEFNQIQKILGRKGRPRPTPQKSESAFYGLFQCDECGSAITPDEKIQTRCTKCKYKFSSKHNDTCPKCKTRISDMKNPKHFRYLYYTCTKKKNPHCSQKGIEADELKKQVNETLKQITISENLKNWYIKHLNEANKKEIRDRKSIQKSVQENYNDCQKKLNNLLNLKISPQNTEGQILNDEEFAKRKSELNMEMQKIKEKLNGVEKRANDWMELAVDTFNFACYAKYHFKNGDFETRKSIILGLGSNLTLRDKKVLILLPKHLETIKNSNSYLMVKKVEFEPIKIGLGYTKTASNMDGFCAKLWGQDSNLRHPR